MEFTFRPEVTVGYYECGRCGGRGFSQRAAHKRGCQDKCIVEGAYNYGLRELLCVLQTGGHPCLTWFDIRTEFTQLGADSDNWQDGARTPGAAALKASARVLLNRVLKEQPSFYKQLHDLAHGQPVPQGVINQAHKMRLMESGDSDDWILTEAIAQTLRLLTRGGRPKARAAHKS